ncbi:acyltransferase family protein [Niastella sp. OAS944]|uniref:acyltransferase family protein n=1 Tax=Niastella sp. OAS944 TaxID=2664089 RepID=UPI00348E21F7|nr:peptidoglycan/LPS O-acetylase OafA/YrhL [Chitinophagaceae bacterium OAS944]
MKLNSIQCLRAVAALLVVYVHSIDVQMEFGVSKQQNFYHLQNFGAIGVDLFFIISGFIITLVANNYKGKEDGVYFLAKRFRRINPVYYIASFIYLGVIVIPILLQGEAANISLQNLISSLIDTVFILPLSGLPLSYSPFLIIGWSLAFEWFFYILFFLAIVTKAKNKALLFVVIIMALVALGYSLQGSDFRYLFITNSIMLEFLIGVCICKLYLNGTKVSNTLALTFLTIGLASYILLIIFGFGLVSELGGVLSGTLSMKRVLLFGLPSACIAFGCIFMEKNNLFGKIWNNKWLLLCGDASYSIYLIHLTVFELFRILYKYAGFFMPADLAIIVQVAIATTISIRFYKWVEQPLIKATHRIAKQKRKSAREPMASAAPAPIP